MRNRKETIGGYRVRMAPVFRRLPMDILDAIPPAARFANSLRKRIERAEVL